LIGAAVGAAAALGARVVDRPRARPADSLSVGDARPIEIHRVPEGLRDRGVESCQLVADRRATLRAHLRVQFVEQRRIRRMIWIPPFPYSRISLTVSAR
jgi:hypothetical protein